MVKLVPRHGFQVVSISARDTAEIYRILTSLEVPAVAQVMETKLSPARLAALDADVAGLEHTLEIENLEVSGPDAQGTANHPAPVSSPELSKKNHRELVDAIKPADAESACAIHKAQRMRSARELSGILRTLDIRHL